MLPIRKLLIFGVLEFLSPKYIIDNYLIKILTYLLVDIINLIEFINCFIVGIQIRDKGITPKLNTETPEWLSSMLQMCWKINPSERATFETLCDTLEENINK